MDNILQPGKSAFPPGLMSGADPGQAPGQGQSPNYKAEPQPKGGVHAKTIVSAVVIVAIILGIIAYLTIYGFNIPGTPSTATTSVSTSSAPTTISTSNAPANTTLPINASSISKVANILSSNALIQMLPNSNSLGMYYVNDSLGIFTQNLTVKYNLTNSTNMYYIFNREYGVPFTANYLESNALVPLNQTIPIPSSYSNYTYPVMFLEHASVLQSPQAAVAAALYHTDCGCLGPTEKVSIAESNSTFKLYLANATVYGMQYYGAFFSYKNFYASMITYGVKGKMNDSYSIAEAKNYYSLLQK